MKRLIIAVLLYSFCLLTYSQKVPPRLLIRVDDMGSTHSANIANLKCIEAGIIQDIQLMVVTPWFPEAARILQEHKDIEVGLHFTITSEWENVKWRPLTLCPSIIDADGYFYPMMNPNKNYPGLSISENKWNIDEIEQELRAQIKLCLKYIPWANNITVHMGLPYNGVQKIEDMLMRVAGEYNMIMVNRGAGKNFADSGFKGSKDTEADFVKWMESLKPGNVYISVEHPAINDPETAATWHIGYTDVAEERQRVTDLLTSEEVKKAIKRLGIELVGYGDVFNVDLTLK